jgi:hypothetical protein
VQRGAIRHGEDGADLDEATGMQRSAISTTFTSRNDDYLDEAASVQRGAISATSNKTTLVEAAEAQRGTITTTHAKTSMPAQHNAIHTTHQV